MRSSLRELEPFPRSCGALAEGGVMCTLTPAFGGPGRLSKTISFLCSTSESLRCDGNVKE